jgi:integrase
LLASYEGAPETKAALELSALTFARPGEVRGAEWGEIDLDGATWSIPAAKMKMRRPHRIPLAPRAVTLLRELHTITGNGRFVFPSNRSRERCMSENTINAALRILGFTKDEMTAHGFRSAASSMLNECGMWHADAIERQLAHIDNDSVRRAYARADYWDERVRIMDWWAGRCSEIEAGGTIVPCGQSDKSSDHLLGCEPTSLEWSDVCFVPNQFGHCVRFVLCNRYSQRKVELL